VDRWWQGNEATLGEQYVFPEETKDFAARGCKTGTVHQRRVCPE